MSSLSPLERISVIDFAAIQGNASRERRRKLPAIDSRCLSSLANGDQYNRFGISPISPKPFSRRSKSDRETLPFRTSLLERYLMEGSHPTPDSRDRKPIVTNHGIANALPGPVEHLWTGDCSTETAKSGWTKPLSTPYPFHKKQHGNLSAPEFQDNAVIPVLMYQNYQPVIRPCFTLDDSELSTPPPSSFGQTFASQLPELHLYTGRSRFDPPPAPGYDCFPDKFPSSPKFSGPAPIDTSLSISRKSDLASAMNSPVLPEERSFAVARSLDPPPAPTFADFSKESRENHVRHDSLTETSSEVRRSAKSMSKASSAQDTTKFSPKRLPRPSPIPINKTVRFADLRSPAHSQLRSPAVYGQFAANSPSPTFISPTTPLATLTTFPAIAGDHYSNPQEEFPHDAEDDLIIFPHGKKGGAHARGRPCNQYSTTDQTRARSLSPPRSARPLLPREDEHLGSLLPATVYDPTVVYDAPTNTRTMVYPALPMVFDTKSHFVRDITDNDRNRILQSYFSRAGCGM
ncbi:hypothetical protein EG328_000344 [Venturia inaequalis]|uniref:Uncharacterized protein n=1 Tax=Venturia inaequalis TaxID=5025 RepID=A0A8H3U404_VENIN|nr:hypothetical protein EG328_000344 [Venturia inaequalis]KAE9990901.1 hypothetical protein EG327_000782 [Venturia inaequalis]